ncbi:MAG: radical SAM protein, partial [Porcipelethomonas sp.]
MNSVGIYIHVPFCAKKCPYCDFYSCSYNMADAKAYTKSVIRDIENSEGSATADTIYFGGGTPSLLPPELMGEIISALKGKFIVSDPEITVEVNPCTVTENKLVRYLEMGINRLS